MLLFRQFLPKYFVWAFSSYKMKQAPIAEI